MEAIEVGSEQPPSVAHVLEKTIQDALHLARAEITLAKQEVAEELGSAARSAVSLLVGVMFLQAALTSLAVLVLMLRGAALGFAVVGGLFAVAVVLGLLGIHGLKRRNLHTVARLKLDVREVAEAVK